MEESNNTSVAQKSKKKGSGVESFFMNSISTTTIHIVVEAITLAVMFLYFKNKISKLNAQVEDLQCEVAEQKDMLHRHDEILRSITPQFRSGAFNQPMNMNQPINQPNQQMNQPNQQNQQVQLTQPLNQQPLQCQMQQAPPQTLLPLQPQMVTQLASMVQGFISQPQTVSSVTELPSHEDLDSELAEELTEMNKP